MPGELTERYAPPWAEGKIEGRHERFDPQDLPMRIEMRCLVCGDAQTRKCDSGDARRWITMFAVTHRQMHRW